VAQFSPFSLARASREPHPRRQTRTCKEPQKSCESQEKRRRLTKFRGIQGAFRADRKEIVDKRAAAQTKQCRAKTRQGAWLSRLGPGLRRRKLRRGKV